jgi:hypothetical protein
MPSTTFSRRFDDNSLCAAARRAVPATIGSDNVDVVNGSIECWPNGRPQRQLPHGHRHPPISPRCGGFYLSSHDLLLFEFIDSMTLLGV